MRVHNNLVASYVKRQFDVNTKRQAKSSEKLGSGYNINRSADDASGLAISEKMRAQIRGMERAQRNTQEAIDLISTADGVMQQMSNKLQRIRELGVLAASDTNELLDREAVQMEIDQLYQEIDHQIHTAEFNTKKLFEPPLVVNPEYETTYKTVQPPEDPAYIFANEAFEPLTVMGGTQPSTSANPTHLAALNAAPNFPLEGSFVIRVDIPGAPNNPLAGTYNAVLDFAVANGPAPGKEGNFSLDDFREFYQGAVVGTDEDGGDIYGGGVFSDLINADELFFEVTDAGGITVRTTGTGGSGARVQIGAPHPSGGKLANSSILGASDSLGVRDGYDIRGQTPNVWGGSYVNLEPGDTFNYNSEDLWAMVPPETSFSFRVVAQNWNQWGTSYSESVTAEVSVTKQELMTLGATTLASVTPDLLDRALQGDPQYGSFIPDSFRLSAPSCYVDREGSVCISLGTSSTRNTAMYPATGRQPYGVDYRAGSNWESSFTDRYSSVSGSNAPNNSLPSLSSNYPAKVSDEIGSFTIGIGGVPGGTGASTIVIDFSTDPKSIHGGSITGPVLSTFTAADENDTAGMVDAINQALNHASMRPNPLRDFPAVSPDPANPLHYPVGMARISGGYLQIVASERRFSVNLSEVQSDRPMLMDPTGSSQGVNRAYTLRIDGTPVADVQLAPGDYENIDDFVSANAPRFAPHYILRTDVPGGDKLVIESVAKGEAVDVRDLSLTTTMAGINVDEFLDTLGFNALPYDAMPYFQDGRSPGTQQEPDGERLVAMELRPQEMWIQTGANEGDGLFLKLPMLSTLTMGLKPSLLGHEYSVRPTKMGLHIRIDYDAPVPEDEAPLTVLSHEKASEAITTANDALNVVNSERAKLGAQQNRLEHTYENLGVATENLTSAESRIRDVDMAKEMSLQTRTSLLTQAATAILAQANALPQNVLQLLR